MNHLVYCIFQVVTNLLKQTRHSQSSASVCITFHNQNLNYFTCRRLQNCCPLINYQKKTLQLHTVEVKQNQTHYSENQKKRPASLSKVEITTIKISLLKKYKVHFKRRQSTDTNRHNFAKGDSTSRRPLLSKIHK